MSGQKIKPKTGLQRTATGQFVRGNQEGGRPKGAKNKITLLKLELEESVRSGSADDMQKVLQLIVKQALKGDHGSQKLVWDATMSKQAIAEDKAAGNKQQITVHTMNVRKDDIEGEFEVVDDSVPIPPEETIQ